MRDPDPAGRPGRDLGDGSNRDPRDDPGKDPWRDPDGERGPGSVGPSRPGPIVVLGCAAAVLGWAVRPLAVALDRPIPLVTWWGVVPIWLLTLVIGAVAVQTWLVLQRAVARGDARRRDRLTSDQAVNRMVLGKAAALAGAAVLGGYGGFALSQVGLATELADARLLRAGAASLGGLLMLLMGLLLEKACRVRKDRT